MPLKKNDYLMFYFVVIDFIENHCIKPFKEKHVYLVIYAILEVDKSYSNKNSAKYWYTALI